MGKPTLEFTPPEGKKDFDNLSVEYKLKLIAYQDEIFRAKKKLQESDIRMNELQTKLDNYLRNKENQLAEIMFTAHTNAQRIESQARSQIQYYLDEMELELQHKQREIEAIEEKTNQFDKALVTPSEPRPEAEKATRLKVVEGSGGEAEPSRKIEKMDIQPEQVLPTAKKQRVVAAKKVRTSKAADMTEKVEPPAKVSKPSVDEVKTQTAAIDATPKAEATASISDDAVDTSQSLEINVAETESVVVAEAVASNKTVAAVEAEPVSNEPGEDGLLKDDAEAIELEEIHANAALEDIAEEAQLVEAVPEPEIAAAPPAAAAKPAEVNERMQLDAFIDVRYFNDITGTRELYHHALQITIEVDVPADNYSVRYTKVSSDVVSTLMKYDNVVLNDLYPFNFVAPNPNSIATYFFNLLDDMLQIMDLRLHQMTMTEFPDMRIVVEQRNVAFDNMLHKGDDMFQDIRKSLPACVEVEPRDSSAIKGTLSKLLKKRL